MGLFGIGDDNRMILDVPVRYAPILGLPYDPDDDSVWEKSDKKINIVVSKGKGVDKAEGDAINQLMEYGIPYQAASNMVGVGSKKKPYKILDNKNDPNWNDWRLEDSSPEDVAASRGRTGKLRGIDVAQGAEYGQQRPITPFYDLDATPFENQTVTGEQGFQAPADPFGVNVIGDESKSVKEAIAAMELEQINMQRLAEQEEAERLAAEELKKREEAEQISADEAQRQVQEELRRIQEERRQLELERDKQRAELEEMRNADPARFAGEEGLGGERDIDPLTGEMRDSTIGANTRSQTLQQALQNQREADRLALEQLGEFTPFDIPQDDAGMGGNTNTSIQEMLNIFNQDPERYYTTETIIGPDGQAITQQVLSPVAQAALQAFSTQRGAEAMETGSRFGAGSPFGVIAGTGGTAQQAIDLAEQQAYSGINSPFAALQTGAGINNISQILRGGLSAQQQSDLAGLQARGGLGVEDQFALAGMQARGGLTPEQMQALAGLQARGGLTPQQRYQEQRLAMMPSLLQMSPQSLGGFSEVFGQENLQNYLSPFFQQPEFAAQGAAPAVNWGAQQALPQSMTPATGTPMEPFQDPTEWGTGGVPISTGRSVPISANRGVPITASGMTANIAESRMPTPQPPTTRQTLGGYRKETPFARGGTQAKAAIAGKELEDYLGEVTPFGGATRRGGFSTSSVSDRFTY